MNTAQANLIDTLRKTFGDAISRSQLVAYCEQNRIAYPNWIANSPQFQTEQRGVYNLAGISSEISDGSVVIESTASDVARNDPPAKFVASPQPASQPALSTMNFMCGESLIPEPLSYYVPFGNHKDIETAIKSKKFFPIFMSGLSGCGKTQTILQVCSDLKRECFRVNITCETDEDDLLGGFRLVNGETKFHKGPVVEAMQRGAILLLDEVDLASTKIMCLQPVLEGKSVYLKKINEVIHPKIGFNIIATANTKGQGSDSGKFVGTTVLNEAFLDRFNATMDQEYPPNGVETKILNKIMRENNTDSEDFVKNLVQWASNIRESFSAGDLTEVISTRRLVHIAEGYNIYKDRVKAIEMCIHRFDKETAKAMLDYYTKIDATIIKEGDEFIVPSGTVTEVEIPDTGVPF